MAIALIVAMAASLVSAAAGSKAKKPAEPASSPGTMQLYPSKYYLIHSDLPAEDVKEAVIRMNHMAEEYHARTQGFSGDIREKLPFYLFRTPVEYYEAGGLPGTAGVFMQRGDSSKLMAIAGDQTNGTTWHVVQHEGFHQFAHAVIRGELPPWVNEGIAEYFGESLFTGDGFVTGVIPPSRLKRVQAEIAGNRLKSVKDMMLTSHEQWNMEMQIENYDQAWSMVHFLAQGENGRYQDAFVNFMKLIGKGVEWPAAWKQTFGDAVGFEQKWKDYWINQPKNPTSNLYVQAITATFTSFVARAATQKQTFDNFDEFVREAKAGNVKTGQTVDDWLPPKLLQDALAASEHAPAKWTLAHTPSKATELVAVLEDDTRMVGTFTVSGARLSKVGVEVDDTGAALKQAQALIAEGKKDQARTLLQHALKNHPRSPLAEDARKLIIQAK
ncbi:MAG TPA: DUF1570 domain-containing protein [Tepidisphaeraceae bacterium]|nr:DUF1570 domain-containing protein [Tepidisphaeraceae bacterium]